MSYRRKIYYFILITVTAACVLGGTARHILGMGSEGRNIFGIAESGDPADSSSGSFMEDLGRFLSVEIKVSAANVAVEYGSDYSISGTFSHNMKPEYKVERNKLTVTQVDAAQKHILGVNDSDCMIKITVPSEAYVSSVDAEIDVGSLNIDKVKANSFRADIGTGSVMMKKLEFSGGSITMKTGNVKLDQIEFRRLGIESGSGDVSLTSEDSLGDCSMDLRTDMGDVRLLGKSYYTVYKKSGDRNHTLNVKVSTGNVNVDKPKMESDKSKA